MGMASCPTIRTPHHPQTTPTHQISTPIQAHHHGSTQHLSFTSHHISPSHSKSFGLQHSCKKNIYTNKKIDRRRLEARNSTTGTGDDDQPDISDTILRLFSASSKNQNAAQLPDLNSNPGTKDKDVLQTILRLHSAFKTQNAPQWPEFIGSLLPVIVLFAGKKQIKESLSSILEFMGNHVEFVIRHTKHDGMEYGLKWSIEWKGIQVPLGRSKLYISHAYQGKVFIRNVKFLLHPLINMKPLKLKVMEIVMPVLDQIANDGSLSDKRRLAIILYCLVTLLSMAIFLILWKNTFV